MKTFVKALFQTILAAAVSCCVTFFIVKRTTPSDKSASQKSSEKIEQLQKRLKYHGNLDRLVLADYAFVKEQNKRNSEFYQNNIKHLEKVADKLRDVIYRKKSICRTLTNEYGFVKEQLLLMQDRKLTAPDYLTAKENYEKLLQVIEQLSTITAQEQDALLMWENVKHLRDEQLKFVNEILERNCTAQLKEPKEEPSEEHCPSVDKEENIATSKS